MSNHVLGVREIGCCPSVICLFIHTPVADFAGALDAQLDWRTVDKDLSTRVTLFHCGQDLVHLCTLPGFAL